MVVNVSYSVVNVIEIEKESISRTVTTCLRPYGNQAVGFKGLKMFN